MNILTKILARHSAPIVALLAFTIAIPSCSTRGASLDASKDTASTRTLAVRLERGPCYGRCAEYTAQVFDDGLIEFDGRRNVKALGVQRRKISVSAVRALQQRFADAGFAKADTAYVEGAAGCGRYLPDGPRTVLDLRIGTMIKSVHHDAGCTGAPRYLQTLASQVDSVAQTSAWITGTGANR